MGFVLSFLSFLKDKIFELRLRDERNGAWVEIDCLCTIDCLFDPLGNGVEFIIDALPFQVSGKMSCV